MSKSKGELLGFLVVAVVKTDEAVESRLLVRGGINVDEASSSHGEAYVVAFAPEGMDRFERPDAKALDAAHDLLNGLVSPLPASCAKPKRRQG